jgi:hypothetical protein
VGTNFDYTNYSSYNLSISVGKEFQHQAGKRWIWYAGADVVPSIFRTQTEFFYNEQKTSTAKESGYGLSLMPMAGIRFDINAKLYIAAEANASLMYKSTSSTTTQHNPDETLRDITAKNFNFQLKPASGIFIFYRF